MAISEAARARREGLKILNGSTVTHFSAIAHFPSDANTACAAAGLGTLEDLERLAKRDHKGNIYKALGALPYMKPAHALQAHRAILAHKGVATIKGPLPLTDPRFDPLDAENTPPPERNGHAAVQAPAPEPSAAGEPFADELVMVRLSSIKPSPSNPRKHFDEAGLAELAASIRAKGVLQPVLLRPHPQRGAMSEAYELVAGERRVRAAGLAGKDVVPAIVRQLSDLQVLEIQVIENEQREDTSALEKSAGYAALVGLGQAVEQIAAKVGKSSSTIRNLLKLQQLPEAAKRAVAEGRLPPATAALLARIPGEELRAKAAAHVLAGDHWWDRKPGSAKNAEPLSYADTKHKIQHFCMVELKGAPFDRKALDLVGDATSCDDCPKRVGNLARQDPEGYAGFRADGCTDPACYQRKCDAHQQRAAEALKGEGVKLLSAKQAEDLFSRWDNCALQYGSAYVDLKSKCHEDPQRRTYQQLVGEACKAHVVAAFDPAGRLRKLVLKEKVLPELRKQGIAKGQRDVAHSYDNAASRRREAEARAKQAAGLAAAYRANAAIAEAAEGLFARLNSLPPAELERLRRLVLVLIRHTWSDACERVAKRRCENSKGGRDTLQGLAAKMQTPSQLLGLVAELGAARETHGWGHPYMGGNDDKEFFAAWGVDRAALVREAAKQKKAKK